MNRELKEVIIDFSKNDMSAITLFTGRKNGKKAKSYFDVRFGDKYVFIAKDTQVITSSFFLGLVGDELINLLSKLSDINSLMERLDFSQLNEVSRNECIRAIKRGLSSEDVSL